MKGFTAWGVVMMLVGLAFFVNAFGIYRRRRRLLDVGRPSVGTVVEVKVEGIVGRNAIIKPVFEFRTEDGALQRAESQLGTGFQSFQIGETIAVLYDPARPGIAEVNSRPVLWGVALLRAGFGAVFTLMGLVGLVLGR